MKECYYHILEVDSTASQEEIKKAYRKKALQMHPDKIMQSASSIPERDQLNSAFLGLQEAFECLSNEHDRIWYDTNKSYILRTESFGGGLKKSTEFMDREELMRFHLKSAFKDFLNGSDPKSFYNVYRKVFATILVEEEKAVEMDLDHVPHFIPSKRVSFGNPQDRYEIDSDLFEFYRFFSTFSSCKSFNWFDVANPLHCQSRREKRLAEKANKKAREEARKAFNLQVIELCRYVKSRDPRVIEGIMLMEEKKNSEELEREKCKLDAARARKELADVYVEQDWSKVQDDEMNEYVDNDESHYEDEYECIVCDKVFKSLKQLENHETSKKHLDLLQEMKIQLQMEDLTLKDDKQVNLIPKPNEEIQVEIEKTKAECSVCSKSFDTLAQLVAHDQSKKHRQALKASKQKSAVMASEEKKELYVLQGSQSKKKRRAKISKEGHQEPFSCNVCKLGFSSKAKLFNHINETGHARAN